MKKLFMAFVACLGFMTANADDVVTLDGVVESGEAGTLTISLNTDNTKYSAYQAYVYVPTGLTFPKKASKKFSDGDIVNEESAGMSYGMNEYTTKKENDGWEGAKEGYDCYLLTAYDPDQCTFTTGGGSLVEINYEASTVTSLPVILSHVVLAETDGITKNVIDIVYPTAVNSIKADGKAAAGEVYGINGIKKAQATKGLNIVDGKKVVK